MLLTTSKRERGKIAVARERKKDRKEKEEETALGELRVDWVGEDVLQAYQYSKRVCA